MFRPVLAIFRCLKRTGLGSYYMHYARTRGVDISTYGLFYLHVVVHLAIKYTYMTTLCLTIYNSQVSHTQRG